MSHETDHLPSSPEVLRRVDALHRRVDDHDRSIVRVETKIEGIDRRLDSQADALAVMGAAQQSLAQSSAQAAESISWIREKLTERVVQAEQRAVQGVRAAESAGGKGAWGLAAGVVSLLTVLASTIYEIVTR